LSKLAKIIDIWLNWLEWSQLSAVNSVYVREIAYSHINLWIIRAFVGWLNFFWYIHYTTMLLWSFSSLSS